MEKQQQNDPAGSYDGLKTYKKDFESVFLKEAGIHYERQCASYLEGNDCSSYMRVAIQRLKEEENRGRKTLHGSTFPKIKSICEDKLISVRRQLMHNEALTYICREQVSDLSNMYSLLSRVESGLDPILAILEKHVRSEGSKKVKDLASSGNITPASFIETIYTLYKHFQGLIEKAFQSNSLFVVSLDKALRSVVNSQQTPSVPGDQSQSTIPSCAELVAKYVDASLRKSSKTASDDELENNLTQADFVFKYIEDKDIFQKLYSKMLAKRLIHGNSISEEAEGIMIAKLRERCGYEYTSKLQRMFTDISLSSDLTTRFCQTESKLSLDFGLKVLVLQSGAWPISSTSFPFAVPPQLARCMQLFEQFYARQHSGRTLNWLHHLATADIKAQFGNKHFEFGATAYQTALLLCYNSADSFTYGKLREIMDLNDKEMYRTVKSLMICNVIQRQGAGKLTKETESQPLTDEMVLEINDKYSNKRKKVKLSAAVPRDAQQSAKQLRDSLNEDRRFFLQAVTVRVMKMRRRLMHNILIKEVIDQASSRFKPSIPHIKRCIEELIEKQYLERDSGDKQILLYVA
eukprot:m.61635 g.61635  ORF g.61635 m.61635 type:complete len:576 (+) comp11432_c0_seq1:816-2543(+)